MLTCASCGRDNAVNARFCSGCGAALEQALQVWVRKRCLPVAGRARERIDSLRQAQV